MKTMKNFLSMAALALMGAMMTGCSSDDNFDNPQQPENKSNVVTLTTTVGFDGGTSTRALASDGKKTFADGDQIAVIYKNSSDQTLKAVGTITSGAGTKTATFTVTLSAPDNTKAIRYIYPAAMAKETIATNATIDDAGTVDFTKLNSQNGSLTTLGSSLDLCTFDAANWTSGTLPNGNLANQLAILAITLKNKAGTDDITNGITSLSVGDGSNVYSVTRDAIAGPIYVAIKPTSSATIGVNASDGTTRYYKELTTKTYAISNGYSVSWKMNEGGAHLSALTGNFTANNGDVLKGTLSGNYQISIADGATVTLDGVTINGTSNGAYQWAGITCQGDATIILKDGTTNTVKGFYYPYPGIFVPGDDTDPSNNKTLTIQGPGSLNASSNGRGAGIGGVWNGNSCGNIVIESGDITAVGGADAAGIGGAQWGTCGYITISGGTVNATGGDYAAGIGCPDDCSCGTITISGGTVTATGGYEGAGIGSGFNSQSICADITISGGSVEATGGNYGAGIGSGDGGVCGYITINGGTVTAAGGNDGAGIGSGDSGTCGTITITAGVISVTATKGSSWAQSIGKGDGGSCGTVNIAGGANVTQN